MDVTRIKHRLRQVHKPCDCCHEFDCLEKLKAYREHYDSDVSWLLNRMEVVTNLLNNNYSAETLWTKIHAWWESLDRDLINDGREIQKT